MQQFTYYLSRALDSVTLFLGFLATAISYVLFPDKAYMAAAIALGGAVLVDIFSKYVSISRRHGGLRESIKAGKLFSKNLWLGTKVKLQAYLSISIMVGLSYRLNALPESFTVVSTFMATVVYTVLFLREFQSIVENFSDAGVENVDWLLIWAKDREKEAIYKYSFGDFEEVCSYSRDNPEESLSNGPKEQISGLDEGRCTGGDYISEDTGTIEDYEKMI